MLTESPLNVIELQHETCKLAIGSIAILHDAIGRIVKIRKTKIIPARLRRLGRERLPLDRLSRGAVVALEQTDIATYADLAGDRLIQLIEQSADHRTIPRDLASVVLDHASGRFALDAICYGLIRNWIDFRELQRFPDGIHGLFAEASYRDCTLSELTASSYHGLTELVRGRFHTQFLFSILGGGLSAQLQYAITAQSIDLVSDRLAQWPMQSTIDTFLAAVEYRRISDLLGRLQPEYLRARRLAPKITAPETPALNATEQAICDVLRQAGHRLTTAQLLPRATGNVNSTNKAILASLRKRGIITNRRDVDPPGYGLVDWG